MIANYHEFAEKSWISSYLVPFKNNRVAASGKLDRNRYKTIKEVRNDVTRPCLLLKTEK